MAQEMYGPNTPTDCLKPIATSSVNGPPRKKSDLSCVGK